MPELGYGVRLLNKIRLLKEVSYQEINSLRELGGEKIPGWEAQAIVQAMKAYDNMSYKARERHCPSPLLSEEEANLAVADSMWASAKGMTQ